MYTNSGAGYRQAAANGATQIGILLIAYDALAADLLLAAEAASTGDIGTRCSRSNHALLLLGHLESWVGFLECEIVATSLRQFYGFLRERICSLQLHAVADGFRDIAKLIVETRAVWQSTEQRLQGLSAASPRSYTYAGVAGSEVALGTTDWMA